MGEPNHTSHCDAEENRLRRQVRRLQRQVHILRDEIDQADAELAREKRHTDIKIGIALQKVDKKIVGFRQGQIVYEKTLTAQERHFEKYGTHESIGPGPFAYGSWIDWGNKNNKPLTPKEVAEWRAQVKAKADAAAKARAHKMQELKRPLSPAEDARIFGIRPPPFIT